MPVPASSEPSASLVLDATRDPAAMTTDERRREVAAILARGVLRLRQSTENAPGSRPSRTPKNTSKSGREALDEGPRTILHVTRVTSLSAGTPENDRNMKGARQP